MAHSFTFLTNGYGNSIYWCPPIGKDAHVRNLVADAIGITKLCKWFSLPVNLNVNSVESIADLCSLRGPSNVTGDVAKCGFNSINGVLRGRGYTNVISESLKTDLPLWKHFYTSATIGFIRMGFWVRGTLKHRAPDTVKALLWSNNTTGRSTMGNLKVAGIREFFPAPTRQSTPSHKRWLCSHSFSAAITKALPTKVMSRFLKSFQSHQHSKTLTRQVASSGWFFNHFASPSVNISTNYTSCSTGTIIVKEGVV